MLFPAIYPVDNAICTLYPPVKASTSITSPAKDKLEIIFDFIVEGSISNVFTPPAVTIASSIGRSPLIFTLKSFKICNNFFRSSLVITFTFLYLILSKMRHQLLLKMQFLNHSICIRLKDYFVMNVLTSMPMYSILYFSNMFQHQ